MNLYEAMFLLDPTFGASMENCESEIRRLLGRAEAEVNFIGKWDERRLAYRINGRKRGVYVLVYFTAPTDKIAGLVRDVQISEEILRLLVLRADDVTREMMERHCEMRGADRSSDDESSDRRGAAPSRADKREPVASGAGAPAVSASGASEEGTAEGAK